MCSARAAQRSASRQQAGRTQSLGGLGQAARSSLGRRKEARKTYPERGVKEKEGSRKRANGLGSQKLTSVSLVFAKAKDKRKPGGATLIPANPTLMPWGPREVTLALS